MQIAAYLKFGPVPRIKVDEDGRRFAANTKEAKTRRSVDPPGRQGGQFDLSAPAGRDVEGA
jgi:hypothetical protein